MKQTLACLPRSLRLASREMRDRALVIPRTAALRTNLQLLHATFAAAGLLDRAWITGGLLLGWARCGQPLRTDLQDADFGFMEADHSAIRAGLTALINEGFEPCTRWRRNDGSTSEWSLTRGGVRCDFFEYRDRGDLIEVTGYFPARSNWEDWEDASGEQIMQCHLLLPRQPLVPFELLARTWLKHEDHVLELDSLYGRRWGAPDREFYGGRGWSTGRDSPSVSERTPWERSVTAWDGSTDGP